MANSYENPKATAVEIVRQNADYTALVAQLGPCEDGIANDLNCRIFKDEYGVPHKCATDASNGTATPAQRIFIADANGALTSHANLKFDGTWLYNGNIRIGETGGNAVIQVYRDSTWVTSITLEA